MSELDPNDDSEAGEYDLAKLGPKWKGELERASRYFEKWRNRCEKIEKIYLAQNTSENSANRSFPMLWANISTLQPAVYARVPSPAVERRFKDPDPVGRVASEMLERILSYQMEKGDLDSLMKQDRDDFLLFARATCWIRYEADIEPQDLGTETSETPQEEQQETAQEQPEEKITAERIAIDYVHWSDFLHTPARRWGDVTWVARRVPMDKDEIKERFGDEAYERLASEVIDTKKGKNDTERAQNAGKTGIWEIWCKSENYTVWIADGSSQALEVSEPPLDLEDFWPCPRPAYGTTSTGSLIPVPDYVYYQGQVEEIDSLTKRINKLTDQLRLVGFYPAGDGDVSSAIERALDPTNDTAMIPIPAWAAFTDKGGSNAIVWLPVEQVQKVMVACIEARKQLIEDVYQITGISDIVRGDTDPNETKGAQVIKSQWGSIRIRDRQGELARFARDITRISGEIICNLFQPQTLMMMSGINLLTNEQKQQAQMQQQQYQLIAGRAQQMGQQPPPPPQGPDPNMMQQPSIDDVVQLLRDDNVRGFRIDIETDSTIEPDENAEKQNRMQFAEVIGGFISQAGPVAQQMPSLVPVMGEVLLFVARGFRTGRQLENSLEQAIGTVSQQVMAPKPPPQPSPDEQIKLQTTQVKAQAEQKKAQLSVVQAGLEHQQAMTEMQRQQQMADQQHAQEMQRTAFQHQQAMEQAAQQSQGPQQ
ncbi:hypothetical protein [Rhizobium rhizogenes]|uniref:hypothetical protein n=1 Tax=Rhizobium rhizogenes TaxID=359 RepID=UPI00157272F2|nr:hypothetical protein [Rhizobium rhizogenes]NTG09255.1 hypothetical protein [Rhizobium rhizogenes]